MIFISNLLVITCVTAQTQLCEAAFDWNITKSCSGSHKNFKMRGPSLYERDDDGLAKFNNSVTDDEVIFDSNDGIVDGYVD